jgi:leucyl-tRNA synthetase
VAEYNPRDIEPRWQRFWKEERVFATPRLPEGPKFYCLDMFPYPSGSGLHVGHPVGYTATDIVSRYKRMRGFSVLHPMGFDAFGLPAEQHAIKTGEHPGKVTDQNCDRFLAQLQQLGLGYDWDREIRTCDPDYYKWTQWIFLQLYDAWFDRDLQKARPIAELPIPDEVRAQGEDAVRAYVDDRRFAYNTEAMVNWCPALGTVLANEEVIDGRSEIGGHEVARKPMKQWTLRITEYAERLLSELETVDWPESIKEMQRNWIGKRHGAEITFDVQGGTERLTCFTTRPDTLFGCTFFVISPEHPLVDALTTAGQRAAVEAYREKARTLSDLDRTIENREKTGVYTGTDVINPINGRAVPLYIGDYVLMSYGTGAVMGVPGHDERDFVFAKNYGLEIVPLIVPENGDPSTIDAILAAEYCYTEPGIMLERPDAVMHELQLAGRASEDAKWIITDWLVAHGAGRRVVNYRFRDWLFARQRYWGEPFPVIHWEDGSVTVLREDELPLVLPEVEEYKPSESGESPLARATQWLEVVDASGKKGRRETNTMPQWAGSCWYYLRFIDPHNEQRFCDPELERAWMPVDLYVGGAEHAVLHLLYARFWHKVLYDLGHVSTAEPFQRLFNQGMLNAPAYKDGRGALVPVDEVTHRDDGSSVRTSTGEALEKINAKMSKSLRNVITPDSVIEEYGADTLRLYLMFMGPLENQRMWDPQAISGVHRFLRRSWMLITDSADTGTRAFVSEADEPVACAKAIHRATRAVTEDLERLSLNTAIAKLMECINELSGQPISRTTAATYTKLLAPLAPHLAEELWRRLGHHDTVGLVTWPTWDEALLAENEVEVVIQVKGRKRGAVLAPRDAQDEPLKHLVVAAMAGTSFAVEATDKFIVVRDKGDGTPKLVNVITRT